jgi:putative hydrolase of the HAD superfamily
MLRHFHDMALSYQVQALKPRPEIFQVALERAGCRPEECFYTDDTAAHVDAARALGIDAERFVDREQLERELRVRGIRWD